MRKRSIAFILFGLAAINLLILPIILAVFGLLYEQMGMPSYAINAGLMTITISGLIPAIILFCAGFVVFFIFREDF